jgi:hypothetical protein
LGIGIIGLDHGDMAEIFKSEAVFFPAHTLGLAVENARRCDGRDAHPVSDKENDVFWSRF